jgi:hypothetical protein
MSHATNVFAVRSTVTPVPHQIQIKYPAPHQLVGKGKKIKLSLCLINSEDIWVCGDAEPPFFALALDKGVWLASRPCRFIPWKTAPAFHCTGGRAGPRTGLDAMEKRFLGCPTSSLVAIPTELSRLFRSLYSGRKCTGYIKGWGTTRGWPWVSTFLLAAVIRFIARS